MCAVIGVVLKPPFDFELIREIFLESSIRGLHATGLSYVKNGIVHTDKKPVPAEKFQFKFDDYVNEDGNLYLVGHCRYSTSDLEYNQPISSEQISVVHNGVITQELPENWKQLYGYDCETKNDTELVLRSLENSESPLERWKTSSLSVIELYSDKKVRFYRNGKRPLYLTYLSNGYIITSTSDIPLRANTKQPAVQVPKDVYYTIDGFVLEEVSVKTGTPEFQFEDSYN